MHALPVLVPMFVTVQLAITDYHAAVRIPLSSQSDCFDPIMNLLNSRMLNIRVLRVYINTINTKSRIQNKLLFLQTAITQIHFKEKPFLILILHYRTTK